MGLVRLLLLVFIAWLVWWLIRPLFRPESKSRQAGEAGREVENMVRCAHCGLNLPQHEAIKADDKYYCSEEHRRLDRN